MNKIDIENNSVNYLSIDELQQYLIKMDDAFYIDNIDIDSTNKKTLKIKTATLNIINYLIKHNDSYIKDLSGNCKGNALSIFYNNEIPIGNEKIELYNSISVLNKTMRLKEVPTFMTREEFDNVMNERCSLDYVVYDLKTESCRNALAKQYKGLIYNTAHKYKNNANNEWEEWLGAAHMGFTQAMNKYIELKGIITKKNSNISYTVKFIVFANWMLTYSMLAAQEQSHLVRIPISAQKSERATKGSNTWDNTISLNNEIGNGDVDDTVAAIFQIGPYKLEDIVSSNTYTDDNVTEDDKNKLFNEFYTYLINKLNNKNVAIFLTHFGLNGLEKISNKEWHTYIKNSTDEDINILYNAILNGNVTTEKQWIKDYEENKFVKRIDAKGSDVSYKVKYVVDWIRHDKNASNALKQLYYF